MKSELLELPKLNKDTFVYYYEEYVTNEGIPAFEIHKFKDIYFTVKRELTSEFYSNFEASKAKLQLPKHEIEITLSTKRKSFDEYMQEYPTARCALTNLVWAEKNSDGETRGGLIILRKERNKTNQQFKLLNVRKEFDEKATPELNDFINDNYTFFTEFDQNFYDYILAGVSGNIPITREMLDRFYLFESSIRNNSASFLIEFYKQEQKDTSLSNQSEILEPDILDFIDKPLLQKHYTRPNYFIKITDKTIVTPFRTEYSPEDLESGFVQPVQIAPKKNKELVNLIEFNAMKNNLRELHLEIIEAYFTEKKANPQAPGVTFVNLTNDLYRSVKGTSLKSKDILVKIVTEEAIKLTSTPFVLNFKQEIEMILSDDSKKNEEVRKRYQEYLDNGGSGIFKTNFIQASVIPIKTANGQVLDGLSFSDQPGDALFFEYLELTKKIKRIPEKLLLNPLSAKSEVNIILHKYLAHKLTQLPYKSRKKKNPKLLDRKLHLLELKENGVIIEETQEYKEAVKYQNSIPSKDLTVTVATIKKDLKLESFRDDRLKERIETLLDYWKSEEIIKEYRINYKSNNRTKESYTIYYF